MMPTRAEMKAASKKQLHDYWGTAILTLVFFMVLGGVFYYFYNLLILQPFAEFNWLALIRLIIAVAVMLLIGIPIVLLGFPTMFVDMSWEQKITPLTPIVHAFRHYGSALILSLATTVFVFLWSLLLLVPGIVKMFSYAMAPYIWADDPAESWRALTASKRMMDGHKMELFILYGSFIGWGLLVLVIVGAFRYLMLALTRDPLMVNVLSAFFAIIGTATLMCYIQMTLVNYYYARKNEQAEIMQALAFDDPSSSETEAQYTGEGRYRKSTRTMQSAPDDTWAYALSSDADEKLASEREHRDAALAEDWSLSVLAAMAHEEEREEEPRPPSADRDWELIFPAEQGGLATTAVSPSTGGCHLRQPLKQLEPLPQTLAAASQAQPSSSARDGVPHHLSASDSCHQVLRPTEPAAAKPAKRKGYWQPPSERQ